MPAEASRIVGMIGEIEAIEELAIESPRFDVQPVGAEPWIPRGLHGDVWHLVQADIVGVVEEAAAWSGQVHEQVRIQHALRSDGRRADGGRVAAEERRLRILGRPRNLELWANIP